MDLKDQRVEGLQLDHGARERLNRGEEPRRTITSDVPLEFCFADGTINTQEIAITNSGAAPALDVTVHIFALFFGYTYPIPNTFRLETDGDEQPNSCPLFRGQR